MAAIILQLLIKYNVAVVRLLPHKRHDAAVNTAASLLRCGGNVVATPLHMISAGPAFAIEIVHCGLRLVYCRTMPFFIAV